MSQQVEAGRNRWWLVAATGLAVFMAVLDMTIVNVALPVIEQDFGTTTSVTEWVVLGYAIPMVALALPSGRWLDQVGRRPALVLATGGFGLASVAAGLAPSIEWLNGARVVQGAFGAVLFALVPAIAASAVRPEFRGRAMGVIGTLGPLGGLSGPTIGGVLVDRLGWSWIFYVNVPVVLVVIAIGYAQLTPDRRLRLPDRTWLGESALLGSAVAVVMLGLSLGAHQFGWLALTLLAVPLMLGWRRLPASRAVRELLRSPGVAAPHLALLLFAVWVSGLQFIAPFYLLRVLEVPAAVAGLTFAALPLAQGLTGLLGGVLADRFGALRIALVGAVTSTVGVALVVPLGTGWTASELAWRLVVVGAGGGLFNSANLALAMSNAPASMLGTAGASTSTVRQLGFGLGPALATIVWAVGGYTVGGMRAAVGLVALVSLLAVVVLGGALRGRTGPPAAASRDRRRVSPTR